MPSHFGTTKNSSHFSCIDGIFNASDNFLMHVSEHIFRIDETISIYPYKQLFFNKRKAKKGS